mmetsp:Transcript_48491/g.105594  ORF Transcript_48491/g.105594 Transcript_48491/m.105594 type:complete len:213 (+) Transcript_48491:395-1033(+)
MQYKSRIRRVLPACSTACTASISVMPTRIRAEMQPCQSSSCVLRAYKSVTLSTENSHAARACSASWGDIPLSCSCWAQRSSWLDVGAAHGFELLAADKTAPARPSLRFLGFGCGALFSTLASAACRRVSRSSALRQCPPCHVDSGSCSQLSGIGLRTSGAGTPLPTISITTEFQWLPPTCTRPHGSLAPGGCMTSGNLSTVSCHIHTGLEKQ